MNTEISNHLSGDSTVSGFVFNGKQVELIYQDYDSKKNYRVIIDTPIIYSATPSSIGDVHLRIDTTSGKLNVDENSGRFILPGDFPKQMAAIKKGYHFLAGLKASEYQKLLILQGSQRILVCPTRSENSIFFEEIDNDKIEILQEQESE